MIQSLVGHGIPTVGHISLASWILQVGHQSTYHPVLPHSQSLSTLANVEDMGRREWHISLIIPRMSYLVQYSCGSAGLVSMEVGATLFTYHAGLLTNEPMIGSALSANLRAAQASIVTNLAASVGGATWMLWVSISDCSDGSHC